MLVAEPGAAVGSRPLPVCGGPDRMARLVVARSELIGSAALVLAAAARDHGVLVVAGRAKGLMMGLSVRA